MICVKGNEVSELRMVLNAEKDHLSKLKRLINSKIDRLVIASPYLSSNIIQLLDEFFFKR